MKIKDSELKAIMAEVQQEVDELLKADTAKLEKAAPMDELEGSAPPASPAPEATPPPPAAEGTAATPEASTAAPSEAPGESLPPGEAGGEIEPTNDPEALKAEYCKLSPEELKLHFEAAKAAMMEVMGGQETAPPMPAPEASAPPTMKQELAGLEPTKATAGKERLEAVAAKKNEMASPGSGGEKLPVKKSELETEVDSLKKRLAEQDTAFEKLVDVLLNKPERKAVTAVAHLAKTQETKVPLSKDEVLNKLKVVTTGKLTKHDRQLVNDYCVGNVSVEKIEHLLK